MNKMARFYCVAIGKYMEWKVNGKPVRDTDIRSREFDYKAFSLTLLNVTQNLQKRKLSVFASANNNSSIIT